MRDFVSTPLAVVGDERGPKVQKLRVQVVDAIQGDFSLIRVAVFDVAHFCPSVQ